MKKRSIVFIVCALVLVILAIGAIWQRDNIRAGLYYLRYSQDEIKQQMDKNEQIIDADIKNITDVTLQPLTEAEREKLQHGELSTQDAVQIMIGTEQSSATTQYFAANEISEATQREQINELIAKIYVLRDVFKGRLEGIKDSAVTSYLALPDAQRTSTSRAQIISQCMNEALALENQCDSEMETILSELTMLLTSLGEDTGVVADVKAIYAEEKAVTKAYYLDLAFK